MYVPVPVTVGQLFSRTFSSLALAPHGIGLLAASSFVAGLMPLVSPVSVGLGILCFLAGAVGAIVASVMVMAQISAGLDDTPLSFGEALRTANRRGGAYFLVSLVVSILCGLASLLLIVPGVMLFLRWYVAAAATVGEQLPVGAAMKRSTELTAGHRWKLFVFTLALGATILVAYLPFAFIGALGGFGPTVMQVGTGVIQGALLASAGAVTLHALRANKEGARSDVVGNVFA